MPHLPRPAIAAGLLLLLAVAGALCGCLASEIQEEHFTIAPDESAGNYSVVMRNIKSDASAPAQQDADFRRLLELWRGDRYLLDRVRGGVYVRERHVALEGGVLVGREEGLFSDLACVDLVLEDDGRVLRALAGGLQVVATNGRVVQAGDSLEVWWPAETKEFRLTTREASFTPSDNLASRFRAWSR
jgi:hypothetical protein